MLDRLIGLFLFFLPLQFAFNPSPQFDLPVGRVIALIIIIWWLVESLAKRDVRLPSPIMTGTTLSLMTWAVASLFWADNWEFAIRKLMFLMNFLPLFFVFYDRMKRDSTVKNKWIGWLIMGSVVSAGISLALFTLQFFIPVGEIHTWLTVHFLPLFLGENLGAMVREYSSLMVNIGGDTYLRATGFFPDPHITSYYFGMLAMISLGFFWEKKSYTLLALTCLLVLIDLLTFSRGGYFGLLAGLIFFLTLGWTGLSHRVQVWIIILLSLGTLVSVTIGQPILSRFVSSFSFNDASSAERIVLWKDAIATIRERPILGTGLGNYILTIRPTAEYREPYYAHNLYLDLGAEIGLFGLFLFLAFIGYAFIRAKYAWSKWRNPEILGILSALSLYLVHSFFDTAFYTVHIFPILLFVISLAWYDGDAYAKDR